MKKLGVFLFAACAAVVGFSYTSETLPNGDTLLKFTTAGDEVWSPARDYERVTVLIVGGGGGGGYGCAAGGGGGGEVIILSNQTFFAGRDYAVTVGAGGTVDSTIRTGGNGGDSSFGDYLAHGGGGGGGDASSASVMQKGVDGGNGGGSAARGSLAGGAGTGKTAVEGDAYYFGGFAGGNGYNGNWNSAGGGGATEAGTTGTGLKGNGGNGGDGLALDITGETVYYGCGGGGGANGNAKDGVVGGAGGNDGISGGNAADGTRGATAGTANTGTGGGAGAYSNERATASGAKGGSGVVYIRIPGDQPVPKVKGYAKSFTFSVCGYKGTEALEDFQLLVRIKEGDGGFSYADLQSDDGRDIRFSLPDDTLLVHEIDTFDPTGTSYFWVKVPELTNGLELKMHWGKANDYKLSAKEVFAGYVGVYHLGEAEGSFADSSPCSVAATRKTNGGNTPFASAGRIGRSTFITDDKVDGNATHGGIFVPSTGILQLPSSTAFTLSGWFRPNGAVSSSSKDEGLFMNSGSTFFVRRYWGGGNSIYCGTAAMSAANIFDGTKSQWFYLTFVYDGAACKVYKNGELVKTVSGSPELAKALAIGCRYNGDGDMSFHGQVDEVRICGEQLSADRIQAEYDQSVTTQKFLSFYDVDRIYVVPPDTVGAKLGTPPYDSWATAATNIADAVAANDDLLDVRIAPGRYPISDRLVLNNPGVSYACVDKTTGAPVYGGAIVDAGGKTWTTSAVSLNGASMRGFMIVNATNTTAAATGGGLYVAADSDPAHFVSDTVISNCCLSGDKSQGGGVYLVNSWRGTVSNCLIVANSAPIGGGLYFYNANAAALESHPTVVDSTFDSNVMNGNWGKGGAAEAAGIEFRNCTFTRNSLASGLSSYSPCVCSEGYVQFLGCSFVGNKSAYPDTSGGSAIYGTPKDVVRGCRFTGNSGVTCYGSFWLENCVLTNNSGRAVMGGASLRNCLVAGNGIGVYISADNATNLIENCTIVGNSSYGIQGNSASSGATQRTLIVNSIVAGNGFGLATPYDYATWRTANDCIVSNSVVTRLFRELGHDASQDLNRWTYTAAQVKFTDAANGDYTLRRRSPCKDKGLLTDWMTEDATDLAGNPRVMKNGKTLAEDPSALPDLGAYENGERTGGVVLILK